MESSAGESNTTVIENEHSENSNKKDDDSMEELKFYDEVKNTSNNSTNPSEEDLKEGCLLMSDSENEENKSAEIKVSPKRILESNDENELANSEPIKVKANKKISNLIDSESEDESMVNVEFEEMTNENTNSKQLLDSESEDEKTFNKHNGKKKKGKTNSLKKSNLIDSESDYSDVNDDEETHKENDDNEAENVQSVEQIEGNKKIIRKSAKKAMDEMQAIQSEQQRLHRDAHISIPYHQPKRHTLQEFLNRRTINRPSMEKPGCDEASPIPKPKSLKMTQEELEEYAKLMDERAKEATEFFKSESEDDEDEHQEVADDTEADQNQTQSKDSETEVQITAEEVTQVEKMNVEHNNFEIVQEESDKIGQEIPKTSNAVIITDIMELPKLDMSTLNISISDEIPVAANIKDTDIKRLIIEKSSNISPALKGAPNMIIDLETGDLMPKKPSGVDNLLQRLMMSSKARKTKTPETVSILSTENGKIELSKHQIHITDDNDARIDHKPGLAYLKLKENLKSIIKKKRMEDIKRKQDEEAKILNHESDDYDDDDEEYEPENKPEKCFDFDDNEKDMACKEDDEDEDDNDEVDQFVDQTIVDEIDEDDDDDEKDNDDDEKDDDDDEKDNDDDEKDSDVENESLDSDEDVINENNGIEKTQKKRILHGFEDDSDNDNVDEVDFLKTPKLATNAPTATQLQLTATKLFDLEDERTPSDEENELLDLCSGNFGDTHHQNIGTKTTPIISQIPITQINSGNDADELMQLCSGTFETQEQDVPSTTNKILSSDEETEQQQQERTKKLTKKMKKKKPKPKLGFSDDEDSESEASCDDDTVENMVEEVETFVDYDSEENEIIVEMPTKDSNMRIENFFEKEAELSESDWGSADEDENNMDKYDVELGDEDEFDREKLRTELGQIHARKMLDEDIREVRKIQELLFEDEETDGIGRQRQFKWKNAENGFCLDDKKDENGEDINGESGDEENEHLWRKIRFEREQLLLEKRLAEDATITTKKVDSAFSKTQDNTNSITKSVVIDSKSVRKLNIITSKKTTNADVKISSPFLISKNSIQSVQQQNVRGSFLVRDKETLTKLAGFTGGIGGMHKDSTAGTVSVKSVKPKNFVFATLTEEEHENLKRKADDLMNSSNENGVNYMKKPKIGPRREKCMIDQLL